MKKLWIALVVLCLYVWLAIKLVDIQQWNNLELLMESRPLWILIILIIEFILLAFNILLEAAKWKFIISPIRVITINEAIRTTLAAMALGNITPARTGEHLGRIAWTPRPHRNLSLAFSFLSSMTQSTVIIMALLLSLPFVIGKTVHIIDLKLIIKIITTLIAASVVITSATILLIRKTKFRYTFLKIRLLFVRKIISHQYLAITLLISTLRYIVFAAQLGLMLYAFQPDINFCLLIPLIPTYYFFITVIPSFFLADIGIKGSVALFIFSGIVHSELAVLTAMFLIWIINSALPTLCGNIILTRKHLKSHRETPSI